jgi:hypothetical protein
MFCIFLFIASSTVFGTLLSQVDRTMHSFVSRYATASPLLCDSVLA